MRQTSQRDELAQLWSVGLLVTREFRKQAGRLPGDLE